MRAKRPKEHKREATMDRTEIGLFLPKHGQSRAGKGWGTRTYVAWRSMRSRCNNPNATGFHNYGGRGITVCNRWGVFENFLADMGERPPGTSLDRIDVNGNYEPGNCRWATAQEQSFGRRTSRVTRETILEIRANAASGENGAEIARRLGLSYFTVRRIITGVRWGWVI